MIDSRRLVQATIRCQQHVERRDTLKRMERVDESAVGHEEFKANEEVRYVERVKVFGNSLSGRYIATCVSMAMVSGCSTMPSQDAQLRASLHQPCPDLQPISDGTGTAILPSAIETVKLYRICQTDTHKLSGRSILRKPRRLHEKSRPKAT